MTASADPDPPRDAPATTPAATPQARDALFAGAAFFRAVRADVAPHLRTWPTVDVWVVGAGTGELAFALAIALREEGLAGRLRVHATDASEGAVLRAREATFASSALLAANHAYRDGGGRASLTDYVNVHEHEGGAFLTVREDVRRDVTFAQHSPTTGGSFHEVQMVVALTALTTRGQSHRARALGVLHESLCRFGILALPPDTFAAHPLRGFYDPLRPEAGLYRKGDA